MAGTFPCPSEAAGCTRCPLWKERTNVVWGAGPVPARIMLVGEAPGYYEDKNGRPFVGRAGVKLNELLTRAGLTREEVYISNRVKCRPPGNRDPLPKEREACYPWLEEEIGAVMPEVVVLLGRTAATMAFPGAVMKDIRGAVRVMGSGAHTAIYLATYHPAAALRQGEVLENCIVQDLQKAKAML